MSTEVNDKDLFLRFSGRTSKAPRHLTSSNILFLAKVPRVSHLWTGWSSPLGPKVWWDHLSLTILFFFFFLGTWPFMAPSLVNPFWAPTFARRASFEDLFTSTPLWGLLHLVFKALFLFSFIFGLWPHST